MANYKNQFIFAVGVYFDRSEDIRASYYKIANGKWYTVPKPPSNLQDWSIAVMGDLLVGLGKKGARYQPSELHVLNLKTAISGSQYYT